MRKQTNTSELAWWERRNSKEIVKKLKKHKGNMSFK